MLLHFQAEAASQTVVMIGQLRVLEECFVTSSTQALEALAQLRDNLPTLIACRDLLAQTAVAIEIAQVRGLTESVRIPEGSSYEFLSLGRQLIPEPL